MAKTTKTFLELIKEYKIIVPLIQRDYAQGREKEKNKAEKFLEAIKNGCKSKLNLDFVYGKRDKENKIFIPLDGQQRLTTLFLIHWYLSLESDYKSDLSKFSYEVRSSSKDFLEELTKNKNWKTFSRKNIKTQVENSNWFFLSWKKDLTIVSLLNMLDLIEKFFENEDINNLNNITFEILYLDEFNLTDELYVKMNARGKPLTLFENFKAEFESYIERTGDSKEVIAKNKASFDNEWLNIFWNLAQKEVEKEQINIDEAPKLADEMFYNFFYNMTFNFYLEKQDKLIKINNKEYSVINEFIKDNDIFSFYKETYEDSSKTIKIINLLNKIKKDNDNKTFNLFVKSIDISQWDRAKFYALYLAYIYDLDEKEFKRWKRISFNLINNQLIQSPDDLIKTIQSLNNLIENSNKDIYEYIKEDSKVINYFTQIQREEESLKAKLILIEQNWEKEIKQAENNWYLEGQIGFLLEFSKNDLGEFVIYREKFEKLWDIKEQNLIQRALLTYENDNEIYSNLTKHGNNKYTFCSFGTLIREKNENWKKIFGSSLFKNLLDDLDLKDVKFSLYEIINKYEFDCSKWQSFIINPNKPWDILSDINNRQIKIENSNVYLNKGSGGVTSWGWSRVAELKSFYTYKYLKEKFNNKNLELKYYPSSEVEDVCFYFDINFNDKNLAIDIKYNTLEDKFVLRSFYRNPQEEKDRKDLDFKISDNRKLANFDNLIKEIFAYLDSLN